MTQLLTINEAAAALSVSVNTVRRMLPKLGAVDLNAGEGTYRMIRIPETAITDYLRKCGIVEISEELPPAPVVPFKLERRKA